MHVFAHDQEDEDDEYLHVDEEEGVERGNGAKASLLDSDDESGMDEDGADEFTDENASWLKPKRKKRVEQVRYRRQFGLA